MGNKFRKVKNLSREEFLKIGKILDDGEEKSFWTHYNKNNCYFELSSPWKINKKIILKYNGELILPKGTSHEKWFEVESYLADLGIERKIFNKGF